MTDKQPEALIRADELETIGAESSLARAMAAHTIRLLYKENEALRARLAQPEPEPVACAECERLKDALKRANGLAEHFERAWYLRGDEIERLTAQPEQEPVAWNPAPGTIDTVPLYTAPPQREWQGLTDEEVFAALVAVDGNTKRLAPGFVAFYCAIEAKLKEKNA